MKNKRLNLAVLIVGILISALLVVWLILSLCINCEYIDVSLPEWITIFGGFEIAFFITYILTNVKTDYERRLDTYQEIISKMQNKLHEDPAHIFFPTMSADVTQKWEFYQKDLLMYFKALWNYYNLIEKYKGDLTIDKEIEFIREHLEKFDFELTANTDSFNSIKSKRTIARREIDLIDVKLDEMKLKLR